MSTNPQTTLTAAQIEMFDRASKGMGDYETIHALCNMALAYFDKVDEGNRMLVAIGEMADAG